jgi:hypothetical protein
MAPRIIIGLFLSFFSLVSCADYKPNAIVSDTINRRVVEIDFYTTAWGTVCSSSPCTVSTTTSGVSVTRASTGDYQVVFPAGVFSARPKCFFTFSNNSNTVMMFMVYTNQSATSFQFKTNDSGAGGLKDTFGSILCIGPK